MSASTVTLRVPQLLPLIGNPNAYAIQRDNGTYYPVEERLTPALLARHLAGDVTIGTYIIKPPNQAKTLVLDFDSGEAANGEAVKAMAALITMGIPERSIALEFSGNKGFHLWVVASTYVPAVWMRRIGKAALALAGVSAEVYPKQDEVRNLGNLVKLPGGVHRVSGNVAHFIGSPPQAVSVAVLERVFKSLPQEAIRVRSTAGQIPLECMAAIQEECGQGWRNTGLFHFATMARRMGVGDDALAAALDVVAARCDPPLDDPEELEGILESSKHSGPICSQLPEEVQCSTCPFQQSGLRIVPGQIAKGKEGELLVVQHAGHKDGKAMVNHPDLREPRYLG